MLMSSDEATTEQTETSEDTGLQFTLATVGEKPSRKYRKGSKYDPILETFMKGRRDLVSVNIPEKDGNYIRTQLNKRVEAKDLQERIKVSVINNVCYLEKIK